jgi:hypothetical protein
MIRLHTRPLPSSPVSISWTGRLRKKDNLQRLKRGGGRAWSRIIRPKESLVLYKSFNPLWRRHSLWWSVEDKIKLQNCVVAEKSCQPTVEGSRATFLLKLGDIYQCMLTKVLNKLTVGAHHQGANWTWGKSLSSSLNLQRITPHSTMHCKEKSDVCIPRKETAHSKPMS